jgi:hypothetical protein
VNRAALDATQTPATPASAPAMEPAEALRARHDAILATLAQDVERLNARLATSAERLERAAAAFEARYGYDPRYPDLRRGA